MNKGRPNTSKAIDGEKIKAVMKAKGINYAILAREIGFTRSYVNVSIKYGWMTAEMLTAISAFLNVPECELCSHQKETFDSVGVR